DRPASRQLGDLALQDLARDGIFVADVDIDLARLDDMRADQHAFEEAVRIGVEIMAVLEGAGLALVAIDRHQARPRLAQHGAPFAASRKAGAAEAAQAAVVEDLQEAL